MPYEKSNKQIQDSVFKMKAGKMGPMQKNFGSELAINKKLDKKSMEGGMTGQPGKTLDGPLAKKKGGIAPTNKTATTEQQAKRNKLKSDVKKFTGGIKKAGSDVNKKLQKAGDYLSAKSIKARKNKKNKVGESSLSVKKDGNLTYTPTKNSSITAPTVEPKTKSKVKVKKRVSYASAYKNADKKKHPTLVSFTKAAKEYNAKKKK